MQQYYKILTAIIILVLTQFDNSYEVLMDNMTTRL
jgi:hypothetical protein